MLPQLLVCVKRTRSRFLYEDFTPEDDILILVASGSFLSGPEGQPQMQIGAAEGAWYRAGVRYFRKILEPAVLYLFRFQPGCVTCPGHKLVFQDKQRIRSTLGLLDQLDEQGDPGDFVYRRSLFRDVMTQLAIESRQLLPDRSDPVVSDAVQYLSRRIHEKITLQAMAERYHMTYVHFCRRFTAAIGMPPSGYLKQLRLRKACTMLSETELPIHRIAKECGFENEYYFSNTFKKHMGQAPTAYRKSTRVPD